MAVVVATEIGEAGMDTDAAGVGAFVDDLKMAKAGGCDGLHPIDVVAGDVEADRPGVECG